MIAVWRAEPHEAEHVARLLVEFRDHLGLDWPSANAFLAGVERLIEQRDTAFLLAAPNEDAPPSGVAQVRFRYSLWRAAEDCLIESLFVRDEARRQGVGHALVEAAVGLARQRGCRQVQAQVAEDDPAALAAHGAAGLTAEDPRAGGRTVVMRLALE